MDLGLFGVCNELSWLGVGLLKPDKTIILVLFSPIIDHPANHRIEGLAPRTAELYSRTAVKALYTWLSILLWAANPGAQRILVVGRWFVPGRELNPDLMVHNPTDLSAHLA